LIPPDKSAASGWFGSAANTCANNFRALTPDDLRDIKAAAEKITVEGARYPEHLQKLVGR
jgi:phage FluMu protein gp41